MASKDFFTWAGKSSASMFCHFNSSRAIVLLQVGRTKRHTLFILTPSSGYCRRTDMRLEEHFESSSTLQRNERVKLAASFWNNVGAGMVIGGMAAAFFLDKPAGTWTKIGI